MIQETGGHKVKLCNGFFYEIISFLSYMFLVLEFPNIFGDLTVEFLISSFL